MRENEKSVQEWECFYNNLFDFENIDFSQLNIPHKQDEFNRLIIVHENLTTQLIFEKCAGLFSCHKWHQASLDKLVIKDERHPRNGTYAIWCKDRIEIDIYRDEKSVEQVKKEGTKTMTLLERELYELKYFIETGKHLDNNTFTTCAGSLYFDGYVPRVCWWNGSSFSIGWHGVSRSYGDHGIREVRS